MCEREEPKMTEHPPEIEGYRCFVNNPDNSHRCDICPHNIGCLDGDTIMDIFFRT